MEAVKDASHLYEVEHRAQHAARPGFRIQELRLSAGETYAVKARRAHLVTNAGKASVTFLVLQGIGEYDYVPLLGA